ncbi:hypothetical protein [Streptomyces sp. NPDC059802]
MITTEVDGEPHGMTVNSLTSVPLYPPRRIVRTDRTGPQDGGADG